MTDPVDLPAAPAFDRDAPLMFSTPAAWAETVLADFDVFLCDHASAEKKASGMAVNMISHYPDRTRLVCVMAELAIEELSHYREVIRLIHERGQILAGDVKDPYVLALRKSIRQGTGEYLLDQLLVGGIIEARGAERFSLLAECLPAGKLQRFYSAIASSERRHHRLFFDLADAYFACDEVNLRAAQLAVIEAQVCAGLALRPALH